MSAPLLLGGDANNNGAIDIFDMSCIGGVYGASSPAIGDCGGQGSPDITGDGRVDIYDLSVAGGNYGATTSNPWP